MNHRGTEHTEEASEADAFDPIEQPRPENPMNFNRGPDDFTRERIVFRNTRCRHLSSAFLLGVFGASVVGSLTPAAWNGDRK